MSYYKINKKYLAIALSFLGFHYFQFNNDNGTIYSFEDTENFRLALSELTKLKNKFNSI